MTRDGERERIMRNRVEGGAGAQCSGATRTCNKLSRRFSPRQFPPSEANEDPKVFTTGAKLEGAYVEPMLQELSADIKLIRFAGHNNRALLGVDQGPRDIAHESQP
eukprot:1359716-Pyramimonas_sp.AAC.1